MISAVVLTEEAKGWRWNVLSVCSGTQSFDLWLCGDAAHPWHCRYPGIDSSRGRVVMLSLQLEDMFQRFFESGGNPLIPYKEVPEHFPELHRLLGDATALE